MLRRLILCLIAAFLLTACNPYAYVNVPPQQGDLATHDPNQQMVRDVEVEALRKLLADRPLQPPIALELPTGTTELTTSDVARRAGEGVTPIHEAPDADSRVQVTQVRIRGLRSEVDVLYPTLAGLPQLLTVYMSYTPINNWRVDRIADWPGATRPVDHAGAQQQP
jgi:hypothetical protein